MRRRWRWRWQLDADKAAAVWLGGLVVLFILMVIVAFATAGPGDVMTMPGYIGACVFGGWAVLGLLGGVVYAFVAFVREHGWPLERVTEPVREDLREQHKP